MQYTHTHSALHLQPPFSSNRLRSFALSAAATSGSSLYLSQTRPSIDDAPTANMALLSEPPPPILTLNKGCECVAYGGGGGRGDEGGTCSVARQPAASGGGCHRRPPSAHSAQPPCGDCAHDGGARRDRRAEAIAEMLKLDLEQVKAALHQVGKTDMMDVG